MERPPHHPIHIQYEMNLAAQEELFQQWEGFQKKEERKEALAIITKGFVAEYVIPEYMPYKEVVSGTVFGLFMVVLVKRLIFKQPSPL